jgi:hypothetical protein
VGTRDSCKVRSNFRFAEVDADNHQMRETVSALPSPSRNKLSSEFHILKSGLKRKNLEQKRQRSRIQDYSRIWMDSVLSLRS